MLSTRHRFLFVHVPKTGGNSVQSVLAPYSDDSIVQAKQHQDGITRFDVISPRYQTNKHSTIADYRRAYGDPMLGQLFKFCCVRNPWERAMSHFFSPHRGPMIWNKQSFMQFVPATVKPLKHFLLGNPNKASKLTQALRNIDFVMRFETLQVDFDSVSKKLALPSKPLPHYNYSNKGACHEYYDDETIHLVATHFHEEIEHFEYTFSG